MKHVAADFASHAYAAAKSGFARASDTVRAERLAECRDCDSFQPRRSRCGACGCDVRIKVQFVVSACPLERWPAR